MNEEELRQKKDHLRRKAESLLKKRDPGTDRSLAETDMLALIQELDIHQIELEMQNEELVRLRSISEDAVKKYTELFDFSPSGYFTLSLEGKILELNLIGAKMLGLDRSVIVNTRLDSFVTHENKPVFRRVLENICTGGINETCEIELINIDNHIVHVLISGVLSEDGDKCNMTVVDISSLKKAEQEIEVEKTRSKQYLDIANVILISIDYSGNVIYINPKGCDILGYPEEEITGTNWFDKFIPSEIREKVRNVAQKISSGEIEALNYYENTVLTRSGEERLIAWYNSVLRDKRGVITGTLSSGEDITERMEKEKELRRYRESLESIVKERTIDLEKTLKDLGERNEELERFFNATVDREIKIEELRVENIELKKELQELSDSKNKQKE